MRTLAAAVLLVLTATAALAQASGWRARAAPDDLRRLDAIDEAWRAALQEARVADAPALRGLGALADPSQALADPLPPPGAYRCRTIKLGAMGEDGLGYAAYGWFRCRVERSPKGEVTLSKYTGSQRLFGALYRDGPRRLMFLGAGHYGYEPSPIPYRAQPDRDEVGVLQRVGPSRWRLALPWPRYESKLDVIELTN